MAEENKQAGQGDLSNEVSDEAKLEYVIDKALLKELRAFLKHVLQRGKAKWVECVADGRHYSALPRNQRLLQQIARRILTVKNCSDKLPELYKEVLARINRNKIKRVEQGAEIRRRVKLYDARIAGYVEDAQKQAKLLHTMLQELQDHQAEVGLWRSVNAWDFGHINTFRETGRIRALGLPRITSAFATVFGVHDKSCKSTVVMPGYVIVELHPREGMHHGQYLTLDAVGKFSICGMPNLELSQDAYGIEYHDISLAYSNCIGAKALSEWANIPVGIGRIVMEYVNEVFVPETLKRYVFSGDKYPFNY